jgi:hypothetical protein
VILCFHSRILRAENLLRDSHETNSVFPQK